MHTLPGRLRVPFLLLFVIVRPARGQDWKASAIPDSLKQGAAMVKRMDLTEIEILSPRKAHIHRKHVYTVLSAAGDRLAYMHTFYDKFNDLTTVTGILY